MSFGSPGPDEALQEEPSAEEASMGNLPPVPPEHHQAAPGHESKAFRSSKGGEDPKGSPAPSKEEAGQAAGGPLWF